MATFHTVLGSLGQYEKGTMEITDDDPMHYVYSNVFEVGERDRRLAAALRARRAQALPVNF